MSETTPLTSKQKQNRLRERRANAGLKRKEYWATPEQHAMLDALLKKMKKKPTHNAKKT